jgi:hypothetical protein
MHDLQGLGTTTRYVVQFQGRNGWCDWISSKEGDGSLETAKKDRDRLTDYSDQPVRITEVTTTVREYCD